jgi:stress response protein YsnF
VSQGQVKVKSHVVETPVTEQVNLRQERVSVERRPVDRPLSGNERAFQDRTIEVEQKGQEAVVSKDARVKEEVVVNKDVEARTKKVSDTVRRTEVEVEDERKSKGGAGSPRTTSTRR